MRPSLEAGPGTPGPTYADAGTGIYATLVAVFCTLLLVSNIGATKGIQFGPVLTDGGVFVFPLTYVIGDILTEVYGLRAARRAIFLGFLMTLVSTLTFWLVMISPGAQGYTGQEAFQTVFGVVPRILLASVAGFVVGELLNSYVVVAMKARSGERRLWNRLFSSTVVGEFFDTLTFCLIAGPVIGITGAAELANYTILGFAIKTAVEFVLLPLVTVPLIRRIKATEPTYTPRKATG